MVFSVLAFGIGTQEIIVILIALVLLFGIAKLPQLGSAISQGILNFKRGMREVEAEDEKAKQAKLENNASTQAIEDKSQDENKS